MKPKKKSKSFGDIEVNQPKITSFFVKKDPNAPQVSSSNPSNLRQSRLNFVAPANPNAGTSTAKNTKRKKGKTSTKRQKLVSTKVIPESQVVTLSSSSEDSNPSSDIPEPDRNNANDSNRAKNKLLETICLARSDLETQRIDIDIDTITEEETENKINSTFNQVTPQIPSFTGGRRSLSFSELGQQPSTSKDQTNVFGKDEKPTEIHIFPFVSSDSILAATPTPTNNNDEEETQDPRVVLDECNNSDAGQRSRSSSPSLLTNIDKRLINGSTVESALNSTFDEVLERQLELAFANTEDVKGTPSEKRQSRSRSRTPPSSSSSKVGSVYVTPLKKLQEPTTPTKSPTRSPPTRAVKSKALYFSPVRHLKTPTKKLASSPARATNGVQKYFSPKKLIVGSSSQSSSSQPVPSADSSSPQFLPYYLQNFEDILSVVSSDDHHLHLFDDNDLNLIHNFNGLSFQAKCLYVRLFQRKWAWRPVTKISYPKIAESMEGYLEELNSKGFLISLTSRDTPTEEKPDLEVLLGLLNGEQINLLAKDMGLKVASKTKESCIEGLLNLPKKQKTLIGNSQDIIYKAACKLIGPVYKVSADSKSLFARIFILYSPPQYWEEDTDQGANQLLTVLLTKIGKMKYPAYRVSKNIKIYPTRQDLLRFQDAWAKHADLQAYCDTKVKDWESAIVVSEEAMEDFKAILQDSEIMNYDKALPSFLRAFTAGSILARTIWLSVDAYQKTKDYKTANEIIEFLLSQTSYSTHYRGRWFERYVINMKHLKKSNDEIRKMILRSLADEHLQASHKLSSQVRLQRLPKGSSGGKLTGKRKASGTNKPKTKKSRRVLISDDEDEEEELAELEPLADAGNEVIPDLLTHKITNRTIEGEKMAFGEERGGKSVFIGPNSSSSPSGNSVSSVESFAIQYYKKNGYQYGIHGEGAVPITLYGLLFWNIIYNDEITDVFHSPHQPYPLDIHFEDFYNQRRSLIETQLTNLKQNWSMDDTLNVIHDNWEAHFDELSVVNWGVFETVDQAKDLVKSMGLQLIASICERFCQNFRYYRSGFPDLVLWNSSQCLFVEVKGPGDSLSTKQSLWLDFLASVEANVEICHVKSVSNKRIRVES